ncbi:MAG: enoyl-CoA hydratase/isomerase family protein [Oscillospiraceae bacterium]|jgi:2-(1,2-epoxy-1,2-dihydrophenyl)acetyl-CoA isomerase|nr:enoyl-CoA hydratase/isomerase family protein [Oscillospiraceae bacterium]
MYDAYQEIIVKTEEKIATITFNRLQFGNAFALATYSEVIDAVEKLGGDDAVGAIVLTGAGKHFSAGGDINRFKELIETKTYLAPENVKTAGKMAMTVRRCPKPVIAMINGAAAGAGCSLALACDFRIVTPKSKLVMAFVNMGLSGDTGGMYYLQKLLGTGKTMEMLMTGAPVSGEEAVRIGLATLLADEDNLAATAYAFAKQLAVKPLVALRHQKALLNEFFYGDLESYTEKEVAYMVDCSHSADFAEAVYAFIEKRPAGFIGK